MRRTIRLRLVLTLVVLALIWLASPAGSQGYSPVAIGMGGAYSAVARNYEAAHLNPANLSLTGNGAWSLNLFSLSCELDNSSLSYNEVSKYSGATLTEDDKADILGLIDGDQLTFDLSGDARALSFTAHGFAFTAANAVFASGGLPRDLVELMFYGNEMGRVYQIGNASGEGMNVTALGISASRALRLPGLSEVLDEFAVGGTFRYLKGWNYGRVEEAYGTLETTMEGLHGAGLLKTRVSSQGSGTGIDIGLAGRRGRLQLGLAFHDLMSKITWEDGEELYTTFSADSITAEELADGEDPIDQDEETIEIGEFEVGIPSTARLGAAMQLGAWTVAGEYMQGWGGDGLTPDAAEFAAGVEHRTTGWLRLRSGVAVGAERTPAFSLGSGMQVAAFQFDLAFSSHGGILPSQDEGVGVALGMGLVFN